MNADLIHQKFNTALQLGCNFAAMRLPNSNDVYFFYASVNPRMLRVQYGAVTQPTFLCSPYGAGNMAYQLKADAVFLNNELIFGELPTAQQASGSWFEGASTQNFYADKAFYENYVNAIVKGIQKDKFDKVVAARSMQISYQGFGKADTYFFDACEKYPNAGVYFFSLKEVGTWFGATPEKLIQLQHQTLTTVALAGTRPVDSDTEWTDKEYDEQGMIEFFIDAAFKQNGINRIQLSEVKTITAGAIQHLCSEFSAKLTPETLTAKFHKLLGSLNPTPAVCGLPQFDASLFISQNEQLERRMYTGFVGLQLPDNSINLLVNLRCAELFKQHAIVYVGAGITAGSNAEKEWFETERKRETIQAIIS